MKSTIKIDAEKKLGGIDRRIYGHFVENMARCIYGGLLRNEKPGDPRGPWRLREELVDAVQAIAPPVIRWPGGLHADGYNWRDGVGPVDARPLRRNRYWSRYGPLTRVLDPNWFGTHEFLSLSERLRAEPYVNVNLGTGSAVEAARWVEYVNGSTDTLEGARRAAYGREKPWGVRTWGVGNEAYGLWSLAHSGPRQYARRYAEFRAAMHEVDPELTYVAVGAEPYFSKQWNREVLSEAGADIDLLSIHIYLPGMERLAGVAAARARGGAAAMYKGIVASPLEFEKRLVAVGKDIKEVVGSSSDIRVALDEWNLWWKPSQLLVPRWTLRDALAICGVFHALHRLNDLVGMANVAQLVNVLGLLSTSGDLIYRSPLYYAFELYATLAGPVRLSSAVTGDTFDSPGVGGIPAMRRVPVLDCSATQSENGKVLTAFVINRDPDSEVTAEVQLGGFEPAGRVAVHCVSGPSERASNWYGRDEVVALSKRSEEVSKVLPQCSFPPHSATALVLKRA